MDKQPNNILGKGTVRTIYEYVISIRTLDIEKAADIMNEKVKEILSVLTATMGMSKETLLDNVVKEFGEALRKDKIDLFFDLVEKTRINDNSRLQLKFAYDVTPIGRKEKIIPYGMKIKKPRPRIEVFLFLILVIGRIKIIENILYNLLDTIENI